MQENFINKIKMQKDFKKLFKIGKKAQNFQKKIDIFKNLGEINGLFEILKTDTNGFNTCKQESFKNRSRKSAAIDQNASSISKYMNNFYNEIKNPLIIILILLGFISCLCFNFDHGKNSINEGPTLIIALWILINFNSIMKTFHEKTFNFKQNKKVEVIRDGLIKEIQTDTLLLGDIVLLKPGDTASFNGVIIENENVEIDESRISDYGKTRKSINFQEENFINPLIYYGSTIINGKCKVLLVDFEDYFSNTTNNGIPMTEFQKKIENYKNFLFVLGYIFVLLGGIMLIVGDIIKKIRIFHEINKFSFSIRLMSVSINLILFFLIFISEDNENLIKKNFCNIVKEIENKNASVENLNSVKNLGKINEILIDEKDMLSINILSRIFIMNREHILDNDENLFLGFNKNTKILKIDDYILEFFHLNFVKIMGKFDEDSNGKYFTNGDIFDESYLNFVNKNQIDIKKFYEFESNDKNSIKIDYNQEEKFMAKSIYLEKNQTYRILIKGDFELFRLKSKIGNIVNNIKIIQSEKNLFEKYIIETIRLDDQNISLIEEYLEKMQENFLDTIFLGFKDVPKNLYEESIRNFPNDPLRLFKNLLKNDINLIGLISCSSSPKKNIRNLVKKSNDLGINLRIMTKENLEHAAATAYKVGILNEFQYDLFLRQKQNPNLKGDSKDLKINFKKRKMIEYYKHIIHLAEENKLFCIDGLTLENISHGIFVLNGKKNLVDKFSFGKIVKNLKVIANCSEEQKLLSVIGLTQLNNRIGIVGQCEKSINFLKESSLSFGIGKNHNQMDKYTPDINLHENNLDSLMEIIQYGRNLNESIRKIIQFKLTFKIVTGIMILCGYMVSNKIIFNPLQIIWIYVIVSLLSMIIFSESNSEKLLHRKHSKNQEQLITKLMIVKVVTQSIFQIFILMVGLFCGDHIFSLNSDIHYNESNWNDNNGFHFTILFNIFVFFQIFNSINARTLVKKEWNSFKGIIHHKMILLYFIILISSQILLIQFGGIYVKLRPLTIFQHLSCILIASTSIILEFYVKIIPNKSLENDEEELIEDKPNHNVREEYLRLVN